MYGMHSLRVASSWCFCSSENIAVAMTGIWHSSGTGAVWPQLGLGGNFLGYTEKLGLKTT